MARQGAGLGLAISRAYVEMLGGKIRVESEVGIGSVFYFTLPYSQECKDKNLVENNLHVEEIEETLEDIKIKILITEDDIISEMILNKIVSKYSKETLIAQNGLEAVDICRKNPDIDLILMDIQMPELGGYEATKQIRGFNKEVVIIAQTAFGLMGDREKAIETGCNDYMSKPIQRDELLTLIQKYFKKK